MGMQLEDAKSQPSIRNALLQPSPPTHTALGAAWGPPPEHALTTVALITVVPTVIFKVALIGERNTGPRLLAPELSVGITDCGCYRAKEGTHYISSSHSPTNLPEEGQLKLGGGRL